MKIGEVFTQPTGKHLIAIQHGNTQRVTVVTAEYGHATGCRSWIIVGCEAQCLHANGVLNFQPHGVPDTDLHEARRPVPDIIEARLPISNLRGEMDLPQIARLLGEDQCQTVLARLKELGHIKSMRAKCVGKGSDFLAVEQDDAGAIQAVKA